MPRPAKRGAGQVSFFGASSRGPVERLWYSALSCARTAPRPGYGKDGAAWRQLRGRQPGALAPPLRVSSSEFALATTRHGEGWFISMGRLSAIGCGRRSSNPTTCVTSSKRYFAPSPPGSAASTRTGPRIAFEDGCGGSYRPSLRTTSGGPAVSRPEPAGPTPTSGCWKSKHPLRAMNRRLMKPRPSSNSGCGRSRPSVASSSPVPGRPFGEWRLGVRVQATWQKTWASRRQPCAWPSPGSCAASATNFKIWKHSHNKRLREANARPVAQRRCPF